jgi:hypothetical protein
METVNATRSLVVAFNTGASYSSHGQRIVAWVRKIEQGYADMACLVDFDRQICCYFPFRWGPQFMGPRDFARHAWHMYDWGQYPLGFDASLASEMNNVLANGYDAFISAPEVTVIGKLSRD